MILVDSSVWIDYFNGTATSGTDLLDAVLGDEQLLTGDIIYAEVLQGFRRDKDFRGAKAALDQLVFAPMVGRDIALASAANYRALRARGVTVRKTIDVIIGTFCLARHHTLLHSDREFDAMEQHLGLAVVRPSL